MSNGILSQESFVAPPETPLGKALDERRSMHGEKIRQRLQRLAAADALAIGPQRTQE